MKNKILWILLAAISILGGIYALANPVLASGFATILVGWVFVALGVVQVVTGFRVLSDEFEPVSVCRGNREPIRNKVDATRRERRCASA
ncbi:hypothetical protein RUA4292_01974 [Ruegeria atlantica]|uniref:Uncharacterized protein n=2 Tax=Ruegeria atlantica TaxID=81569 RepID=A0A0P1EEB0_9RHOB|nr:hypothetical protein RUA4292_01974 [Ruegeria atlantica]